MSVGGVLGGAVLRLLAPLIFDWTYEHPLLLVAAAFDPGNDSTRSSELLEERRNSRAPATTGESPTLLVLSLVGQGAFGLPDSRHRRDARIAAR